ncbi:MAG: hypothetical protein GY755_20670 [Chloroflexi bacterium]|nr:hypothetical protein [Chloroflexota bacterium]
MQSQRDVELNEAASATLENDYEKACTIVQKLLRLDPDDIEALLLFSLVVDNEEYSIQALQRVLQINPDHPIAFVELARKKSALPIEIPSPQAPKTKPITPLPVQKPPVAPVIKEKESPKLKSSPSLTPPQKKKRASLELFIAIALIVTCICIGVIVFQGLLN